VYKIEPNLGIASIFGSLNEMRLLGSKSGSMEINFFSLFGNAVELV
jgi:hypothetical protein